MPGATAAEAIAKANSLLNIVGARGAVVTVSSVGLDASTDEVTVSIDIPMKQERAGGAASSRRIRRSIAQRRCEPSGQQY